MSSFNVDFKKLGMLLLPTFLRRPIIASLVCSAVTPVGYLHTRLMRLREDTDYRLRHNGQVCHLRGVLNDLFDYDERRIIIEDVAEEDGGVTLYMHEEQRAMILSRQETGKVVVLTQRRFAGANRYDFAVVIPDALKGTIDEARLRAVVGMYKLASKRFIITYR